MAGTKYQDKFYFPEGHIYVLMDDDWGVEIIGEDEINGDLVGMGSWDFKTRESWMAWGDFCIDKIKDIQGQYNDGFITEIDVADKICEIEDQMDDAIKKDLIEL